MAARRIQIAIIALLVSLSAVEGAAAVTLNPGQSARIDFSVTTGTGVFDFVTLTLDFSNSNPFGTNETLMFSTFDGNNAALTSVTFDSGSSVYTSGLFASLTQNAIVPFNSATTLNTNSFHAIVTAVSGSFDLTAAQANFEHIFTAGTNQFGVNGSISLVPLPASLPMFGAAFFTLAAASCRLERKTRRAS